MNDNKDFLAKEPVGKLLLKLALPTVTAQIINMLYNIIDRIYIGHIPENGALALTGVGVCMPLIMIVSAFAALVGNGGAPRASIFMGQGDKQAAEKTLGNCFTVQLIISAVLTAVLLMWNREFLLAFGASENTVEYGVAYMNIYALGTIFVQLTLGMNAFITAQGLQNRHALRYDRCGSKYYPGSDFHFCIWNGSTRRGSGNYLITGIILYLGAGLPLRKKDLLKDQSFQFKAYPFHYHAKPCAGTVHLYHAVQ